MTGSGKHQTMSSHPFLTMTPETMQTSTGLMSFNEVTSGLVCRCTAEEMDQVAKSINAQLTREQGQFAVRTHAQRAGTENSFASAEWIIGTALVGSSIALLLAASVAGTNSLLRRRRDDLLHELRLGFPWYIIVLRLMMFPAFTIAIPGVLSYVMGALSTPMTPEIHAAILWLTLMLFGTSLVHISVYAVKASTDP